MGKCHICGKVTDWECQQCEEFVCENCTMPYNQFTQIDYTLCKICGGEKEKEKNDEYIRHGQEEKQRLIEKQNRNERQRAYYHSEKATQKRRLKKIEKLKIEQEYREERAKVIADIFEDMFKHM